MVGNGYINEDDSRWEIITQILLNFAQKKYKYDSYHAEVGDQLDAFIEGILMMGEELQSTTIDINYLDNLFDNVGDILLVLDSDLKVIRCNKAAVESLGYKYNQLLNLDIYELIDDNYKEFLTLQFNTSSENRTKYFDIYLLRQNNSNFPASITISQLLTTKADKVEQQILIIAKDISELLLTKNRLKERNSELNTLFYRISHDLRTPVANIKGIINLLHLQNENMSSEINTYIDMIETSNLKLDAILKFFNEINFLNSLSKEKVVLDFYKLFESIQSQITLKHPNPKYKLTFEYHNENQIEYRASYSVLEKILISLVENSIIHSNKCNHLNIHLSVEINSRFVEILIKDNGIGIDVKYHDRVFEMFYRVNISNTGSGMGLYFVKNAVDFLDGEIKLESTINKGCLFTLKLPLSSL